MPFRSMADQDDRTFFHQRLWLGLTRWTYVRLAYAFVVLMAFLGLFLVQRRGNEIDQESKQRAYIVCIAQNDNRKVISDIVDFTYSRGAAVQPTPEVAKARQEFIDYVHLVTKPIDCPPDPGR